MTIALYLSVCQVIQQKIAKQLLASSNLGSATELAFVYFFPNTIKMVTVFVCHNFTFRNAISCLVQSLNPLLHG